MPNFGHLLHKTGFVDSDMHTIVPLYCAILEKFFTYQARCADFSTSQLKSNQEPDAKIHNMTKILKNSQRAVLS